MPAFGAFVIYSVMIVVLILRPHGLFRAAEMTGKVAPVSVPLATQLARAFERRAGWRLGEVLFWAMSVLVLLGLPSRSLLLNEIAILALFALSLDLVLGYAGIVSLGHAAFFGTGAYVAGLLTKHGIADPTLGLLVAAAASAALGSRRAFSSFAVPISRG